MSDEPVAEEVTAGTDILWIELPPEAIDKMGKCGDECADRYHNHWHCNCGQLCEEIPAKPVVTASTAKTEKTGILRGSIWGGKAMCRKHDSSVPWDSVQGRRARGESEDEWEDRRLEETEAEERDEYVPEHVSWVRATWNEETAKAYNLSEERAYQPNMSCVECGGTQECRLVVSISYFEEYESTNWQDDGLYTLCRRHDTSVTPAVARAYLRRAEVRRKQAKAEKAKVARHKALAKQPPP